MKKILFALVILSNFTFAIDEEKLKIECREFNNISSCKQLFIYNKSLCENGEDRGCFNLGLAYSTGGYGVEENIHLARYYLQILCDKNYEIQTTCFKVGAIYYLRSDMPNAKKYYKKACLSGEEDACKAFQELQ